MNSQAHEWLTDTLAATSTAGAIEGDDWSFNTATTRPVRRTNRTQIFRKDIAVSETQRAVNPAGSGMILGSAYKNGCMLEHCECLATLEKGDNAMDDAVNQQGTLWDSSETTSHSPKHRVRDLAFLGGFFEGEGCIGAHYNNGHPFVYVKITNTDHSLIRWIHETFGGRVQNKGGKIPANWKVSLDWYCRADEIIPFLKMLIPFLKSKRGRAYKGMAIKTMIERKMGRDKIVQAIDELKAMNRRGRYSPLQ